MEFELFSDVILTRDLQEDGLRAGDIGTVVDRHTVRGFDGVGYSVEFFDMTGRTLAVVTVPARALRVSCARGKAGGLSAHDLIDRRARRRRVGKSGRRTPAASRPASSLRFPY